METRREFLGKAAAGAVVATPLAAAVMATTSDDVVRVGAYELESTEYEGAETFAVLATSDGDLVAAFDRVQAQADNLWRGFLEPLTGDMAALWRHLLDERGLNTVEVIDRNSWEARFAAGMLPGHGSRITTPRYTWDVREEYVKARPVDERVTTVDANVFSHRISDPEAFVIPFSFVPPNQYARGGQVAVFGSIPAIIGSLADELRRLVDAAWAASVDPAFEMTCVADVPTPFLVVKDCVAEFSVSVHSAGMVHRPGACPRVPKPTSNA